MSPTVRDRATVVAGAALIASMYLPWYRTTSEETFFEDYYGASAGGHQGRVQVDAWWFALPSAITLAATAAAVLFAVRRLDIAEGAEGALPLGHRVVSGAPAVVIAFLLALPPGLSGLFLPAWGAWLALSLAVVIVACSLVGSPGDGGQGRPPRLIRPMPSGPLASAGVALVAASYLRWFEISRPREFLATHYDLRVESAPEVQGVALWWFALPSALVLGSALTIAAVGVLYLDGRRARPRARLTAILAAAVAAVTTVLVHAAQPGADEIFDPTGAGWAGLLGAAVAVAGVAAAATRRAAPERARPGG